MRPNHVPALEDLAPVALAYRWAVVVSSLAVAYIAELQDVAIAPSAALALLAMSLGITWISSQTAASHMLLPALMLDVAIGAGCVVLTGGVESPFIFYLSVPLLRCAMHTWLLPMGAGSVAVLAALGTIHLTDPDGRLTLLLGINEVAVLFAGPWLVFTIVKRLPTRVSPARSVPWRPSLDADDRELLTLLRSGATYTTISETLGFSPDTIKARVARLYRRLGARNRTEAIAAADAVEGQDEHT
jgi:DNA-binding CsgD family transcriptional regulator